MTHPRAGVKTPANDEPRPSGAKDGVRRWAGSQGFARCSTFTASRTRTPPGVRGFGDVALRLVGAFSAHVMDAGSVRRTFEFSADLVR